MIDTKAIRSKILDLAMHGKISIQNENEAVDFDAEVATDIPYAIPSNWKWVTIESIITKNVGGGTPSKSVNEYWKNGTIPWMSVKDFSSARNGVLEDTIDHITQEGLKNSSSNLVDVNAIIICMRMALGKIVKLKRPMAINQDLRAIWINSCVDRDYFIFYYSTLRVEGHGMTVAGINKKQLMTYLMPLPPLAEQKRIVEKIEQAFSVLDTIDELQAQYADNLTALKSKLIDLAIRGKLTEQLPEDGTAEELYQQIQEEKQALIKSGKIKKEKLLPEIAETEIPFEIPESWKWVRLGEFGSWHAGATPARGNSAYYNGSIPWLKTGDLNDNYISSVPEYITELALKECSVQLNPVGSVLIAMYGATIGKLGIAKIPLTTNQACCACIPHNGIYNRFLFFLLMSMRKTFIGMGIGGAQSNISRDKIVNAVVPLSPLAEQKRIVDRLDKLLAVYDEMR